MKNFVKYCSKCNKTLEDSDKYCRYCGAEAIEKPLEKNNSEVSFFSALVYGPPYSVKHVCSNCGRVYIEQGLGSPSARYCSECGTKYDSYKDRDEDRVGEYCSSEDFGMPSDDFIANFFSDLD